MVRKGTRRGRKRRAEANETDSDSPAVWPGLEGGCYCPLSEQEVATVHDSALMLLESLGLCQATPSMIERVTSAGGVMADDGRLRFPRDLVESAIRNARREITLHGRNAGLDITLGGRRVHMSSGGGAPNVVDMESGQYRMGGLKDLYDAARLCDALTNVHHFSRSVIASDAPTNRLLDVNTAYACLAGTAKPVAMSIVEADNVPLVADMCYELAGGEQEFRDRPFLTVLACHVVPPMRFAEDSCDVVEAAILAGFPVQLISAGQAGATSPAAIAGSLVQAVAETLAGLVHAQLVDPDAKAIFAPKPLVADLRTGAMSGGGGEQAVLMAAAAQMGRHYDLPTSSIAGITDSKIPDAQHGSEKTLAVSLAAHAGSNLITQACGMQASLLGVSFEGYVADNDMLGNILRTIRGVEATPDNMSTDAIAEVCLGEGHYLGHGQTLERMKSDYAYPELGDRRAPEDWFEAGASALRHRAKDRARLILDGHFPELIPAEIDRGLRKNFDIMLSRDDMRANT